MVENPLYAPGDIFTIDILVDDVTNLWSFDLSMSYDPSVVTATNILVNVLDPVAGKGFLLEETTSAIDNDLGLLSVSSNRGPNGLVMGELLGVSDGVNKLYYVKYPAVGDRNGDGLIDKYDVTVYFNGTEQPASAVRDVVSGSGRIRLSATLPAPAAGTVITIDYFHPGLTTTAVVPMCSITFHVESRGISALDMHDTQMLDIDLNPIDHELFDGLFDNTFQGWVTVPIYKNVGLMPTNESSIEITADHVELDTQGYPLWGISFNLWYDTTVLTAIDPEALLNLPYGRIGINTKIFDSEGYIHVEVENMSLVTEDPVPFVRMKFTLDAEGWSTLLLTDLLAVSETGEKRFFDLRSNGSFASVDVIELKRAWPEDYLFFMNWEPDNIDTLYAKVKTAVTGDPITFQVIFTIYDWKAGIPVGTIATPPTTIPENTEMTVSADFDVTASGIPWSKGWWGMKWYFAKIVAEVHYDSNGDGIMDSLGKGTKSILILVIKWG
jgi:hypothetical protein